MNRSGNRPCPITLLGLRPAVWRLAPLCGLSAGVVASGALADEWSAKSRFVESVEISDNRALTPDSAGETYGFTSQLMLDAVAQFRTSRLELNADVSYRDLFGPGADENASPTDNGLRFSLENRPNSVSKYQFSGFWRRQDATTAQLADTGSTTVRGDINTFVLEGGVSRQVSALDELTWSGQGKRVDFTEDSDISYTDVTSMVGWSRRLSPVSRLLTSAEFELVSRDDPQDTQTTIGRARTGLEYHFTRDLTFNGGAGFGVRHTDQNNVPNAGIDTSEAGTDTEWLADMQLAYLPLPKTELSFSAVHAITPNILGEVENRTTVGFNVRHAINRASNLWLATDYTHQVLSGGIVDQGDSDYYRASIAYDRRLTPEWLAQVSYKFAHRVDDTGTANSNTFYFTAVYENTILP